MIQFVQVVLPLALDRPFTYYWDQLPVLQVGQRVIVSFGRSKFYTAIVYKIGLTAPDYTVKPIEEVLDKEPLFTSNQFEFWEWIAQYYLCSVGEVMRASLPSTLLLESESVVALLDTNFRDLELTDSEYLICEVLEKAPQKLSFLTKQSGITSCTRAVTNLLSKEIIERFEVMGKSTTEKKLPYLVLKDPELAKVQLLNSKAPVQREMILHFFSEAKGTDRVAWLTFSKKYNLSISARNSLVAKQIFKLEYIATDRIKPKIEAEQFYELTKVQRDAEASINEGLSQSKPVLLHGLTGSGKTMLYISAIERELEKGNQVLFLLPEIALTHSLWSRINKRFPGKVVAFSSQLNANERTELWHKVRNNHSTAQVVVGARSALLLPFKRLGLIVVDEEHDSSFKQHDPAPRYHARDVAVFLSHKVKCGIILGSATPSLESLYNCGFGGNKNPKYHYVYLGERYGVEGLPQIQLLDLKNLKKRKQLKSWISEPVIQAVTSTISEGMQVLFFQNRRGYSSLIECLECGFIPGCKNCDVSLTYHRSDQSLRCHYCGYKEPVSLSCSKCQSKSLDKHGLGTQQIEMLLRDLFPELTVARMDRDTLKGKRGHQELLESFDRGEVQLLVGTQMVSKGIDFKNIGLVVVLSADQLVHRADYRAHERAAQQLLQVAGRAGRSVTKPTQVLIQTYDPGNTVLQNVLKRTYLSFAENELIERKEFHYPPFYRMIKIQFLSRNLPKVLDGAAWFATGLRQFPGIEVLGNDAPSIERMRNQYYQQILIKIPPTVSLVGLKEAIGRLKKSFEAIPAFSGIGVVFHVDHI
jgi:primosomal protein N' (replication factor Y) (superfamily II helicase)